MKRSPWYRDWWSVPMWHWTHFACLALLFALPIVCLVHDCRHPKPPAKAPPAPAAGTCCPCE